MGPPLIQLIVTLSRQCCGLIRIGLIRRDFLLDSSDVLGDVALLHAVDQLPELIVIRIVSLLPIYDELRRIGLVTVNSGHDLLIQAVIDALADVLLQSAAKGGSRILEAFRELVVVNSH